jgi:hypothetical protein
MAYQEGAGMVFIFEWTPIKMANLPRALLSSWSEEMQSPGCKWVIAFKGVVVDKTLACFAKAVSMEKRHITRSNKLKRITES